MSNFRIKDRFIALTFLSSNKRTNELENETEREFRASQADVARNRKSRRERETGIEEMFLACFLFSFVSSLRGGEARTLP